jgi:hypothetical protein
MQSFLGYPLKFPGFHVVPQEYNAKFSPEPTQRIEGRPTLPSVRMQGGELRGREGTRGEGTGATRGST